MKILIDENKYLTCFCIDAELAGGIEVEAPEDVESFVDIFQAYRYEDGQLILGQEKLEKINNDKIICELRLKRSKLCFPYVDRGGLWYGRLTAEQKAELDAWYQAWLDVTETKKMPNMPEWLK